MAEANYNGRQPNNTSYIKTFIEAPIPQLWTINQYYYASSNIEVLTPDSNIKDVYIPGNLYVGGKIINKDFSNNNDYSSAVLQDLFNTITNLQNQIDVLNAKINSK